MTIEEKFEQGVSLLKKEQPEAALDIFNELVKLEPNNASFYSERGVVFFHLSRRKESLKDMDKAIELEPSKSYRYSSRAYIRGHFKMINEAITDYKKAIELDPDDAIAHNNLGLLEEQLGYREKAKLNFTRADALSQETIDGRKELNVEGEKIQAINLQSEINEERKKNSIWKELRSLGTKKGRSSFLLFLKSGFKKW